MIKTHIDRRIDSFFEHSPTSYLIDLTVDRNWHIVSIVADEDLLAAIIIDIADNQFSGSIEDNEFQEFPLPVGAIVRIDDLLKIALGLTGEFPNLEFAEARPLWWWTYDPDLDIF